MDIPFVLNYYSRKIGIGLLGFVSMILICLLVIIGLFPKNDISFGRLTILQIKIIATILYLILITIALPFSLNGILMERAFNNQIKEIVKKGMLIQGVEGFSEITTRIRLLYKGANSVIIIAIVSFLVFLSAIQLEKYNILFLLAACIGLLFLSNGISIVLKLPGKSALKPGGLMKFYEPKSFPLKLDNLLSDSIFTRLDPITRMRFDEWSKTIQNYMNKNFRPRLDMQTRVEQAREKIFLLVYLQEFVPELMTEETFNRELSEIISPDYLQSFINGEESNISLNTIKTIICDVKDELPQIFELIQRIFVLVVENLWYLRKKDIFISISHPSIHIGNIDPIRIIVFILNLENISKQVNVKVQSSMDALDPDDPSQKLVLDPSEIPLPSQDKKIEFSSSNREIDVLTLVSSILQIGDTINFQFRPNRTGTHVINLAIEDLDGNLIVGRSIVIKVTRDINYYVKTVGGKLISYVGAALSFIGIGIGSLANLFGL